LVAQGLPALGETLARLDIGNVQVVPPDLEQGSYEPPVRHAELDWDQPYEQIDRLVRAGHPDQPPYFTYRGRRRYVYAMRRVGPRAEERPGLIGAGRDGEMPAAVADAVVAVRWRPVGHTHAVRPLAKQQFP
jgi:methionyl-tRNA formyltransferase